MFQETMFLQRILAKTATASSSRPHFPYIFGNRLFAAATTDQSCVGAEVQILLQKSKGAFEIKLNPRHSGMQLLLPRVYGNGASNPQAVYDTGFDRAPNHDFPVDCAKVFAEILSQRLHRPCISSIQHASGSTNMSRRGWIHHPTRCLSEKSQSCEQAEAAAAYQTITAEKIEDGKIGLLMLNRPKILNALSAACMREVVSALKDFDSAAEVGAIVISGKGKAFAAGVDVNELKEKTLVDSILSPFLSDWNEVSAIRKPIIAAVNGYALGGGCELAMMCDIVLVGEKAVFGQPEVKIGTIPGMGGTQRLIREVGKSRAMEMILTGERFMDAKEACQRGLASRIISGTNEELMAEAIALAKSISSLSRPAVLMAKAAVNAAYENNLQEGVRKEQALFGATYGLQDQKEGMKAFIEKRKPHAISYGPGRKAPLGSSHFSRKRRRRTFFEGLHFPCEFLNLLPLFVLLSPRPHCMTL